MLRQIGSFDFGRHQRKIARAVLGIVFDLEALVKVNFVFWPPVGMNSHTKLSPPE